MSTPLDNTAHMDVPDSRMLEVSVLHKRPSQRQGMLLSMTSTYTSVCRILTQTDISRQPCCLREDNGAYRPIKTPREPQRLLKVLSDVASWCSTRKKAFVSSPHNTEHSSFCLWKTLANSNFNQRTYRQLRETPVCRALNPQPCPSCP
jgi:hypothetical protein